MAKQRFSFCKKGYFHLLFILFPKEKTGYLMNVCKNVSNYFFPKFSSAFCLCLHFFQALRIPVNNFLWQALFTMSKMTTAWRIEGQCSETHGKDKKITTIVILIGIYDVPDLFLTKLSCCQPPTIACHKNGHTSLFFFLGTIDLEKS